MKTAKYLIIGAGLAGAEAAKKIREIDTSGSIIIVGQEPHAPYHRPPLTKEFMQGKKPLSEIFVESEGWYKLNHIELIMGKKVHSLDAAARTVTLSDGETIGYSKARLATGGRPAKIGIPGDNIGCVHYLRTLDDAMGVSNQAVKGRRAVVLGGGFIGMELASSLTERGMSVSLVQRGRQLWSRFMGPELADYFKSYCTARGVTFFLGETARSIQGNAHVTEVVLESGKSLPCDMLVIALGIELNTELAAQAGLKVDDGVIVNEFMQTSNPDIYAAGDIANYPDPYFGYRRRVEHWGQAEYTGGLAGANMAGQAEKYDLLTYVWSDIFDLHLEFGGDERQSERTIMRGRVEDNAFAVLYVKGGQVTAFFGVNLKKKQYQPFNQLIKQKVDIRGKESQLADPNFDVQSLLAQPVAK